MDAQGTLAIALEMEVGDKLKISSSSKQELNKTRMALSRAREKMPPMLKNCLQITTDHRTLQTIISRSEAVQTMVIEKASGAVKPVLSVEDRAEYERVLDMMREDGVDEEEINQFKLEHGV